MLTRTAVCGGTQASCLAAGRAPVRTSQVSNVTKIDETVA
jgi:hypothetical protein